MFSFLEHLHQKPRAARVRAALFMAFVVTFLIAGIWALDFTTRFTEERDVVKKSSGESPFTLIQFKAEEILEDVF